MIEPINKIWHFGSYAFFPYRFGFITMFLLIVGAGYAFNQYDSVKSIIPIKNKMFSVILTILITSVIAVITATHYNDFQLAISKLTISTNHVLLFILLISTILSFIGCYLIIVFNKNLNKFSLVLIGVITISHIMVNTTIYLGIDSTQKELINQYLLLNEIAKDYKDNNNYRVKNELNNMIMNSSLVMKYSSLDHFSSLSDGNTLSTLKKMGYSSFWVKTSSRGGNLFLDNILANKYIMTRENINNKIKLLGISSKLTTEKFLIIRLITTIIIFLFILINYKYGYILSIIVSIIYYFLLEKIVLDSKIKKRRKKLDIEAIYFFEVLTLSLQTGRNLSEAILVTTSSIEDELSLEFKETLRETKYGKSLTESLTDMQNRIPSDSINNIILALTQANIYGSSIISTMYNQVDYLREKRKMEVKATISKIPTKISIISVFFFIPLILLIILGPAILSYIK